MKSNRNPFRYDAEFDLDNIVGRKNEIKWTERAIQDGQRVFFIGPRGFGKTSILRAAQATMSRKDAIVLYVNAETSPDVRKLIGEIIAGVAVQVYGGAECIGRSSRPYECASGRQQRHTSGQSY
jgi:type II secretory pathway predicted ATPase ExeA